MKKLINAPAAVRAESLDGFAAAHADIVVLGADRKYIARRAMRPGKVGLVSGGGSGHEPLHLGFVGHGMLDAVCPGEVFTSPTPDQMVAACEAADMGAGILLVVKNYEGDVMNFDMAREIVGDSGRTVDTVIVNDDVSVENSTYTTGRRGVAGTLVVEKLVGAAAEQMRPVPDLKSIGQRIVDDTRSMGVALASCTSPSAGKPTFSLGDAEMEMGVGIHGEPGRARTTIKSAADIADEMLASITADLKAPTGSPVLLFVNGFGATPLIELYVMYDAARRILEKRGFRIARSLVGSYVTALDMAGCSLTVTRLSDDMIELWDAKVHTASLRWGL